LRKLILEKKTLIGLFILVGGVTFSEASYAQEFTSGIRPGGMGDAFTAVADGTAAIYHNPAGSARSVMYALEASYEYTPTGNVLAASIVDSKTNPQLSAGLGYSYFFARDSEVKGHDIRLSLAIPIVPDKISVGVGGRYLIIGDTQKIENEAGTRVDTDVEILNGFTLDAGIMIKLAPQFHIGVAGQNLIDQCNRVDCKSIAPTIIQGGVGFTTEDGLIISGDFGADLSSGPEVGIEFGVGAEYLISVVPVRVGFFRKGVSETNWVTFGGGWRSKAAGIDVGMKLNLDDTSVFQTGGSISVYF